VRSSWRSLNRNVANPSDLKQSRGKSAPILVDSWIILREKVQQIQKPLARGLVGFDRLKEFIELFGDLVLAERCRTFLGQSDLGLQLCDLRSLREARQNRLRLIEFTPVSQELCEREASHVVRRLQLESLPQRGLITLLDQQVNYRLCRGELGDKLAHLGLGIGADEAVNDLPVLDREHRRYPLDLKSLGRSWIIINVDLDQLHFAFGLRDYLLDNRTERPAWSTPGCPKIHHNGPILRRLDHILFKGSISYVHTSLFYLVSHRPTGRPYLVDDFEYHEKMTDHQSPFSETALTWIREFGQLSGALTIELCPGGRSNLTYRIQDETGESVILRRPPASMVLPTAHDMGREFRFLSALAPTGFAVPRPLAFCDDSALIGAPFYLMNEAKGLILRDDKQASAVPVTTRQVIGPNLITTLAQLHSFDPAALGLPMMADPHTYLGRQLERWLKQVSSVVTFDTDLINTVLHVGEALRAHMPTTEAIGIVHGDYRLDNVVLTDQGEVVAVLDWEIASVGDPLADIGMLGVYWMDATDDRMRGINSATRLEGFTSRAELYEHYGALRHTDPERIIYYQHFGSWKLACILIGVVERYRRGASGGDQSSIDDYPALINELLGAAQPSR